MLHIFFLTFVILMHYFHWRFEVNDVVEFRGEKNWNIKSISSGILSSECPYGWSFHKLPPLVCDVLLNISLPESD